MSNKRRYITPEDYVIAEQNGIKKTTFEARVRSLGWDIEKARTKPSGLIKTMLTDEQKRRVKELGISRSTVWKRVQQGMSVDEAIEKPVENRFKRGSGVFSLDEQKMLDENGVSNSTALNRIRLGWSKHDAIHEPIGKPGIRRAKKD